MDSEKIQKIRILKENVKNGQCAELQECYSNCSGIGIGISAGNNEESLVFYFENKPSFEAPNEVNGIKISYKIGTIQFL